MRNGQQESVWKDIIWAWQGLYDANAAVQKFQSDQQYSPEAGTTRVATAYWLLNMQTLKQVSTVTKCKTPLCICFRNHAAVFNPTTRSQQFQLSSGDLIKVSPNSVNWRRLSLGSDISEASVSNATTPASVPISCQHLNPKKSHNQRCGSIEGQDDIQCEPKQCCSIYGYCGQTTQHCANGCQPQFGLCW